MGNRQNKVNSETRANYRVDQDTTDQKQKEDEVIALALGYLEARVQVGAVLVTPTLTRDYLILKVSQLEHEVFGCVFLTNRHRIIDICELFRGTIDGASVYPREVVKEVLMRNAAAVIFYHNHPSGITEPSSADITLTRRLKTALEIVEVRVLDHFIVGGGTAISFAEIGLL